ncbi:7-carboxy-7-deazaguanine synthase [Kribbella kalugense]|uniref:7-carboxy-7-deazaguanine synthase n=1 Tax=Kribbella kalugense TaxID=2512221 RepID=A0A4V3G7G3_9ACTN|nr:7-carboxy-7-deazaguanine synthase [Kribbella kalugense]TDW18964.1 7-carboxy-7-deazaguanine synthase (Cx14CxxC type) [Kribbella kalugense]
MTYKVKEIFYTLQGEGTHAGRPAVFCRFSSCNLWTGLEKDRDRAICKFCDTDFVGTDGEGGGKFRDADSLAEAISSKWPSVSGGRPMVVFTGGEPLLQLDDVAVDALKTRGFYVAVETNGTISPPNGIDWLCVSPKIGSQLVVHRGQELKFVIPQAGVDPISFEHLDFTSFRVQPMDGPDLAVNTELAVKFCMENPRWQLSLQTHKYLGIP